MEKEEEGEKRNVEGREIQRVKEEDTSNNMYVFTVHGI